jgi:hypothetical protein
MGNLLVQVIEEVVMIFLFKERKISPQLVTLYLLLFNSFIFTVGMFAYFLFSSATLIHI